MPQEDNVIVAIDWIGILSASLTPTIAVAALILGILQYRLAKQRRNDDLFDRRYAFYDRLRTIWLSTGTGAPDGHDPSVDVLDLVPLAEEASFLFGQDIVDHVLSLEGPGHSGHPDFPNDDFIAPFRKYLSFDER